MDLSITEIDFVKARIITLRGLKVILDRDLAELYQVATKNLNKAVKRNLGRFPSDFMFQLTDDEVKNLRFQIGTANFSPKLRYLPFVFTEQGVAMLSSVLNSEVAIEINILIMRAFVEMRQTALIYPEYELILEKMKRIEAEMKLNNMSHLAEHHLKSDKLMQLSREVRLLNQRLESFSDILDDFRNAHIVIRRPEGGLV